MYMNKHTLEEKNIHQNPMFPVSVYWSDYKWRTELLLHWHDDIEIIYILDGKAVFKIDDSLIEVSKGQALFINSGELHSGGSLKYYPETNYYIIVYHPEILSSNINDLCQSRYVKPLLHNHFKMPRLIEGNAAWEEAVLSDIKDIIAYFTDKPAGYEMGIKSALYHLFSQVIINGRLDKSSLKVESIDKDRLDTLKRVLTYVQRNYTEKITIHDLAKEANMSKSHFCYFFKMLTGLTPVTYINHYRVNQAATLLAKHGCKVIDAALKAGFDNVSYFIKIFKRVKGITPFEYRRAPD